MNNTQQHEHLWTTGDIAAFMSVSKRTLQNNIARAMREDGFPAPREIVSGGKRWIPREVKAWVERRRINPAS